jgi:pimeloyl-ACP methyl ester carboxylesterase
VLLMDYRGYGGNPGKPTQQGLARDVRAAREYLAGVAGMRSPFVDLAAVGRHHYPMLPVRALLRDRYPVADLIGQLTAPTVVVYGTADSVVPPQQSRAVAARAHGPVRLIAVENADHNDPVLLDGAPVVNAVIELADGING